MTTKIPMVSHARHVYKGRSLAPHDAFTVDSDADADELKILGFASRAPQAQTYATRVMVAEQATAPVASAEAEKSKDAAPAEDAAPRTKRPYHRRDLNVEK